MEVQYVAWGHNTCNLTVLSRGARPARRVEQQLKTFYAGDLFPFCSECGRKVRYVLPGRVLRKKISTPAQKIP